jgi:PAS domain S-box-containing protein
MGDGVIVTDAEARVEMMNRVAESLTGWTNENACGKPLEEVFRIVNERTRQPVEPPVQRVLRENVVVGLANHTVLIARDGTERAIADSAAPVSDEDGSVTGVVFVFRDQTEERRGEMALRQNEAQFRSIYHESPIGIELYDHNGALLDLNKACLGIFGIADVSTVKGFKLFDDPNLSAEDKEMLHRGENVRREIAFDCEKVKAARLYEMTKPGIIHLDLLIKPLGGAAPELAIGYLVHVRDITDRKRAEESLRRSEKRRAEAEKEKLVATASMAARVAHEINNPLAGIQNSFRLIRGAVPDDHPDHDMVERIEREIDRIANIVRQMYTLYRPRAEKTVDVVVADAARDVLLMLEPLRREHEVQLDSSSIHPGLTVRISEGGLHQVLYNLVVNAIEVSPRGGGVALSAEVARAENDLEFVEITVCDGGAGILPESRDRIFEPFFTSKDDDSTTRGLGMGLSVVKGIVEPAGGRIEFQSTPGQGTVFRVFLPHNPEV